jgi:Na+/H+ antiporter NhaD/arsenite permease-like protein
MTDLQIIITLSVFSAVILTIAFNLLDMALAAMLGVSVLVLLGIFKVHYFASALETAGGPLSLLFGGMVVARVLATTGLFDLLGNLFLKATKGSGKRFLLLLLVMVAPLCAFLPNATTVILLAPIIVRVATALEIDFVGPVILAAIVSNSAGLLTLVGDPSIFMVGSSIGMDFTAYLAKISLGGLLSVLAVHLYFLSRDIKAAFRRFGVDTSKGLKLDKEEHYLAAAKSVFEKDPSVVLYLYGHAHIPSMRAVGKRYVINTGTWLKMLERVSAFFRLLPDVYVPAYRFNFFKVNPRLGRGIPKG